MKNFPEINRALQWFENRQWQAFPFQVETWNHCLDGKSGLLNAPTGSGKTYALFIGSALSCLREAQTENQTKSNVPL